MRSETHSLFECQEYSLIKHATNFVRSLNSNGNNFQAHTSMFDEFQEVLEQNF